MSFRDGGIYPGRNNEMAFFTSRCSILLKLQFVANMAFAICRSIVSFVDFGVVTIKELKLPDSFFFLRDGSAQLSPFAEELADELGSKSEADSEK